MAKIQQLPRSFDATKLKTVDQLKGKFKEFLLDDQILKLAFDRLIPHYILRHPLTGQEYFYFINTEVNEWYTGNYISYIRSEQQFYEQRVTVLAFNYECYKIGVQDEIPVELVAVENLYKYPITDHRGTPPSIYFLCRDNKVVYVGQTSNMGDRIREHIKCEDKKFTHIYFMPFHKGNLLVAEAAFIKHFNPEYNIIHAIKSENWKIA